MSDDSLLTRYRPETFDDVLGQEAVAASIQKVLEDGSARAFLLSGPSGTGKTTLARIIAASLEAREGDIIEVDAATRTGVDSVRELQEAVRFRPIGGGSRVIILDEAHRLSAAAWEALLKTIEEPPKGVYWCLCTTNPAKVPETIQTRCMCYALGLVDAAEIRALLALVNEEEGFDAVPEVLNYCADIAMGSPRRALSVLAQVYHCETRSEAARIGSKATEDTAGVVDFCRMLARGATAWPAYAALLRKMKGTNAESIRIQVVAYFETIALSEPKGRQADRKSELALLVLDCFGQPYPPTANQLYPLILSTQAVLQELS